MSFLFAATEVAQEHQVPVIGHLNYWIIIGLMMTGLFLILSKSNMVKTIIGLNFFQVSVIMFYVSMGRIDYVEDYATEDVSDDLIIRGTAPILLEKDIPKEDHANKSEQSTTHGSTETPAGAIAAAKSSQQQFDGRPL